MLGPASAYPTTPVETDIDYCLQYRLFSSAFEEAIGAGVTNVKPAASTRTNLLRRPNVIRRAKAGLSTHPIAICEQGPEQRQPDQRDGRGAIDSSVPF
jgi:hypothetical protein